jgi:hypothetical protein
MRLFQAIDNIREKIGGIQSSEGTDLWSTILNQIRKKKCFDHEYAAAIEEIIRSLVAGLDDDTVIAMWRETETGMADAADDEKLVPDCVRMDLEMELFEAIMDLAYDDAQEKGGF